MKKIKITQFKKNIFSGSFIHGLNILIVLVSYPLYIKYLGFELFSVWTALSVVIAFARMGEFGISKAIISYVSKESENKNEINSIVTNAFYIISLVSVILLVSIWLLKAPIVGLLNIPAIHVDEARSILPLLAVSIILFLYHDMYGGVISGKNRLDIVNLILLLNNILKVAISIVLLAKGLSLMAIVYATILSNLIFTVVQILLIIYKFKIPVYRLGPLSFKHIGKLFNFGASIMGMQFFNMLSVPLIKVVLSNSIGVEAVGIFELAQKPAYSLRTLFQKGLFAVMPDISALSVKKSTDTALAIRQRVWKITKVVAVFGVPFFILLSVTAPIWLKLWLGDTYSNMILHGFWILQPGVIIGLIVLPLYFALLGTENHRYCLYESIIRAVITIALCALYFVLNIGINYSFLFITISVILSNMFIVYGFNKEFKAKNGK